MVAATEAGPLPGPPLPHCRGWRPLACDKLIHQDALGCVLSTLMLAARGRHA